MFRHIKLRPWKFQNKAQASLELVVSLFILLLLIAGSLRLFVWLNERMVLRQEDYEGTVSGSTGFSRATAGSPDQSKNGLPIREESDMSANPVRYKDLNLDLIKGESQ